MFLVVDLFVATTRAMTALRRNKINKRTQISPIGMIETNINRRQDYFIHLDEIRPLPLCTAATSIRAYHLQLKGKQKVAGKGLLKHKQHRFGGAGGGGTPGNSCWGSSARFSKSGPYFRPKNVIFHTRFRRGL